MKIEIDLDDVFRGEDGAPDETAEETIRRQIVARLSGDMRNRLFDRLDEELSRAINAQVSQVVASQMPSLIDDLMTATYTPVSAYGQRSAPTNFRAELVRAISEQMVFRPRSSSFEENAFTKAVRSIVDGQAEAFRKELRGMIDEKFKNDAIAYAVAELSKRLGLSK